MKTLIVLLFVVINLFACNLGSASYKPKSESETVVTSPTPKPDTCVEANYKHKSEAELTAMPPAQRIDEVVKEQLYHMPNVEDYPASLGIYLRKDGVQVMPVLTEYMNAYDPKNYSKCEGMRFHVAFTRSGDIDDNVVRLRGIKEGQLAIDALERGIERMRDAGFDKSNHKRSGDFNFALLHLKLLKGINISDRSIMDTFWVQHKIKMSDSELLEFCNFLILRDPTYPAWSEMTGLIKDHSRTNEAGYPLQVYLLKKPERYYEAYLEFKKTKRLGE
jgi:hypothetical protein